MLAGTAPDPGTDPAEAGTGMEITAPADGVSLGGWTAWLDPSSGSFYFINDATKESTWAQPAQYRYTVRSCNHA